MPPKRIDMHVHVGIPGDDPVFRRYGAICSLDAPSCRAPSQSAHGELAGGAGHLRRRPPDVPKPRDHCARPREKRTECLLSSAISASPTRRQRLASTHTGT